MNVNHVKDEEVKELPEYEVPTVLMGIFERQRELHKKYRHIEVKNKLGLGLVFGIKYSVDNPNWQYLIKDFAWRVTEELTEAMEAEFCGNKVHEIEELIDALHFYTELLIICEYNHIDVLVHSLGIVNPNSPIDMIIYQLGLACNLLKNKPWKNTHLVTDQKRFKDHLIQGYKKLLVYILGEVDTYENLYKMYYKKSLVNKFRISSNY